MKRTTFLKTLLVAVTLVAGVNFAWAETKTLYPTGSIDPAILSTWSYHASVYTEQGDGYVDFRNQTANNYRGVHLKFFETDSDIYGNYDTYTVSFDFWNNNSWSMDKSSDAEIVFYGEGAGIPNPLYSLFSGSNTTKKNYLLYLHGSGTWIQNFYINESDKNPVNFSKQNWYTVSITVTRSTGTVSYSITPQGSSTPITNGSGTYTASSDQTSFNCQGLYFSLGRGCYDTRIANVKVSTEVVSGTITDAGWSTFASSNALDLNTLTAKSGATAYYASEATGSTVTLTSTTAKVPADEGIMIKGTAGETFTIGVAASGTSISGNLLKGQTTTGDVTASGTDDKYHYVFGFNTGDPSIYGFYNLASTTEVPAGKAYLETTTALTLPGAARLTIVFDDEATGIDNLTPALSEGEGVVYNLRGQRVDQPTKGLYIVNGKKVVMK